MCVRDGPSSIVDDVRSGAARNGESVVGPVQASLFSVRTENNENTYFRFDIKC